VWDGRQDNRTKLEGSEEASANHFFSYPTLPVIPLATIVHQVSSNKAIELAIDSSTGKEAAMNRMLE
jgi:hypothetical protein